MGFDDTVCVDGHAYAIWIGERIPTTKTPSISAPLYQTITRAYVNVAKDSHSLCGEKLTPAQVQAVTWVTYRRILGYWIMNDVPGLDYYFDQMLDAYLEEYFEDRENQMWDDDLDFSDKDE